MSVQNAGAIIREARLKAGLSQEKLSEGICSTLSLSRIENGTAGVSPSTFQALMAHAGAPCEAFPIFANRTDFDCFYTLKRARFYLDCWQLKECYEELDKIENINFAENKFYYQEWLLLHCKLQFRSGCGNHHEIYATLLDSLHISRPEIIFSDFRDLLLSLNEIELLVAIAQETLYLNQPKVCLEICTQLSSYLENSQITFLEKGKLLAENAVVYTKFLLSTGEYHTALKVADRFRHQAVINSNDASLHELTFLTGLGYFYQNNLSTALTHFKTAFFSAHSIGSCFATICRNYLCLDLHLDLPEDLVKVPDIPLSAYEQKKVIDTSDFSDGTYDLFSSDTLTIGSLIRELRIEQNISQQTLSTGLCSKSKLSKIENGTLQPTVILAETLLQRLGISDTVFTFFGDERESQLHGLRLSSIHTKVYHNQDLLYYTDKMKELLDTKDILYRQYVDFREALYLPSTVSAAERLLGALKTTLQDFSLNTIQNYRLSWMELTILNNYNHAVAKSISLSQGIRQIYKTLDYLDTVSYDILLAQKIYPITVSDLLCYSHALHHYSEMIELQPLLSHPSICCHTYHLGIMYANLCQAIGAEGNLNLAQQMLNYSYYNLLINEVEKKAQTIANYLRNDFGLCPT